MLATRISFMNEIANLCELVGADISDVRKAVGSDNRIGRHFLFPGIGYGGSCFPKDVKALINTASGHGYELRLCGATDEVNQTQRELFWRKIERHFGGNLAGKRFGVWGISFKPETDDIREAPSLYVIDRLVSSGAEVVAHDPVALENAKRHLGEKIYCGESNYDACRDADALVICTEWNEYRQPDFQAMKELMKGHVIFDGRNLYDPKRLSREGFKYYGIGIGT
jgi:UDPglucose 6-dehydrogenase